MDYLSRRKSQMTETTEVPGGRVSVLMPVCNGERYLSGALRSLFNQEGVSFDVWISDDASTDGTANILADYERQCHVIRQTHRLGLARNHQFLQRYATGDFVTFLHQDDLLVRDSLRTRVEILDSNPSVLWASCDVEGVDSTDQPIGIRRNRGIPRPEDLTRMTSQQREAVRWHCLRVFLRANPILMPSVILRRPFLEAVGAFNPNLDYTVDYEYWLRCLLWAPLAHIPLPLVRYRWHSSQTSANYAGRPNAANLQKLTAVDSAYRHAVTMVLDIPLSVQLMWWGVRVLRGVASHFALEKLDAFIPRTMMTLSR